MDCRTPRIQCGLIMDDNLEGKYQNVIRRLENDLLAAEMRHQFYAETLTKMTLTEHRLRDALRWALPYVKSNERVESIVRSALKEKI